MSMSVEFVKPHLEHLIHVAENMRDADRIEVWASNELTPIEALISSVDLSAYSSVALFKGVPCAVFGLVVNGLLTSTGCPWLLGTDDIDLCKKDFIKHTRTGVQEMLSICSRLENYVHVDNRKSVRWLKAMGFKFGNPERIGKHQELFVKFSLEKYDV